ncbi:MFS transporter [Virgibacillus salexigens]|uniref:MFS transporter n=1 Tax=Virgibacillus massiliensis TaxID=1462526 RepID=UPI00136EE69D|nr:MFS transporter [Virgibacillus massiliensis]MYL40124.1 MFS transporter [Virgibacillus massiliensis]
MWKFVLPGIAMIGVTYAFARFSFGLFLPHITESLDLTESNAGFVGSTAYASYTLALLTASLFIQKWGQLRVIQLAGISAILGLLGIAFSPNFYILALSTFIAGLGSGWSSPAFSQVAATSLREKDRDRGNTWMNSGTSFGLIVSGPIALLFTEHWRLSFLLFALMAIVVFIWNTIRIPTPASFPSQDKTVTGSRSLKRAKWLIIASIMVGGSSSVFWTFSRSYLTAVYQMSDFESVFFWILMGISGIIGGVAGSFINKIGLSLAYRLTLLIMMTSLVIITIPNPITIYTSSIFFGVSYIVMTGILIVWSTRIFTSLPSIGVSLSFLSLGIGQSIGSFIAGGTIDAISYPFTFVLFSLIGLVGVIVPTKNSN